MSLARRHLGLQGGRSSVSGITATVFGATGFLGRYVVNRLGKTGTRVVVPFRGDEKDVRHLKVMGDLGVVNFVETSIRSLEQIEAAVADADVVVNLLGKHYETLRWRFADVHTSFPAVLAEVCAPQSVERTLTLTLSLSLPLPPCGTKARAVLPWVTEHRAWGRPTRTLTEP